MEITILVFLWFLGFLFTILLYPRIPYYLCITSGLFWGAIIYIVEAIILGLVGLYSVLIWFILGATFLALLVSHILRRQSVRTFPWMKSLKIAFAVIALSVILVVFLGGKQAFMGTTDSLSYIVFSTHFFNSGSLIIPGGGFFFHGHYGVSEMLINALGGFISKPMLTLWHPALFISLYTSLTGMVYESAINFGLNRKKAFSVSLAIAIWAGTASMNWVNSFYLHIHLFASYCLTFVFYYAWKAVSTDRESGIELFLVSLAIGAYGLSRSESPVAIFIFLALIAFSKKFSRKERYVLFPLSMVIVSGWMLFLLLAYPGTENNFWPDSRIILALIAYVLFGIFILFWETLKISKYRKVLGKTVSYGIFFIPLILFFISPDSVLENIYAIFTHFFGFGRYIGLGSWVFHMPGIILILLASFSYLKTNKGDSEIRDRYQLPIKLISAYIILLIFLGFMRMYQSGGSFTPGRWGDSASRMITHIAPSIAFFTSLIVSEIFAQKITNNKTTEA